MAEPSEKDLDILQDLANRGVIEIKTYWCSELGFRDQDVDKGHFHGLGSTHEVDTFTLVHDPPLVERETKMPEPITFKLNLRKDLTEPEEDQIKDG